MPPTFKPVVHLRVTKARQHESYDDIKPGLTVAWLSTLEYTTTLKKTNNCPQCYKLAHVGIKRKRNNINSVSLNEYIAALV